MIAPNWYRRVSILFLALILILTSCVMDKGAINVKIPRKNSQSEPSEEVTLAGTTVTNVQLVNKQIVITGTNLSAVTNVKTTNTALSFNHNFSIESKSNTQIIANSSTPLTFMANVVFNLVLSNAHAAASFSINFNLCDGLLNGKSINCSVAVNDKDVLSYDAVSETWKPRQVNGLNYLGTWDAGPGIAPTTQPAGSYYVISVAGTIGAITFSVGDWIVSNGSAYQKIDNSTAIISVHGRTGAVVSAEGDYNLNQLTDVDLSVAPVTGKVLKFNGTHWIASDDLSGGGAGSVTSTEIAAGAVTDAKIADVAASKITGTINGTQIGAGVIMNSHVNASAAIDYSKLNVPDGAILYAKLTVADNEIPASKVNGLGTAIGAMVEDIIANGEVTKAPSQNAVYDALSGKLNTTGGTITPGYLSVGTPILGADAANKDYVDNSISTGVSTKVSKAGDTMTGDLNIDANLKLKGTSNYVTLRSDSSTATYTMTLPANAGTTGYVLTTDGSGVLSWSNPSAVAQGSGTVDSAAITDGSIVDADVSGTANIAQSKIAGLTTALSGKEPTIATGSTAQYIRGDKSLSTFATDAINSTLSGFVTGSNTAIVATDSVLQALQKAQGQIAAREGTITAGTTAQYYRGDKSWQTLDTSVVTENSNLYFTEPRVLGTDLAGFSATNSAIVATDTVLQGFNKAQGQINNINTTISGMSSSQWGESSGNVYRASGNVAIGTTSTSQKLDVRGDVNIGSAGTTTQLMFRGSSANEIISYASGEMRILNSGNINLIPTGNVGIGTSIPGEKLHVSGGDIRLDNNHALFFRDQANTGSLGIKADASDRITFRTGAFWDRLVIDSSGNVGIGTPTPTNGALDISSTSDDILSLHRKNNSLNNATKIHFHHNNVSAAKVETVELSSIQTDATDGSINGDFAISTVNNSSKGERLRILSDGNVGIGTATPTAKLEIAGNLALNTSEYRWASNISLPHADASTGKRVLLTLPAVPQNTKVIVRGVRATNDGANVFDAEFKVAVTSGTTQFRVLEEKVANTMVVYDWYFDSATGVAYLRFGHVGNSYVYSVSVISTKTNVPTLAIDSGSAPAFPVVNAEYSQRTTLNDDFLLYTNGAERLRINGSGNIGIGTTNPQTSLDVAGSVRLGTDATACSGANAGAMRFNSPNVEYCNGTVWQAFSSAGSGSVGSTQIADGSIVDADVSASAAIAQSKIANLTTDLAGKEPTITAGTTAQYIRGNKTLGTFASDVLATLLSGLSTATNAVISATDSVILAFGKLQRQITELDNSKLNKTGGTLSVGTISGVPTPTNADDVANKGYVDSFGQWTKSGSDINRASGNVGIGVGSPTSKLEVAGVVHSTTGGFKFPDGTTQTTAAGAGSGVSDNYQYFTTPGTHTYTVPAGITTLQVTVGGAGGAGMSGGSSANANSGGASSFGAHCTANGGQGGRGTSIDMRGATHGTSSGGDSNLVGGGAAGGRGGVYNSAGSWAAGDGGNGGLCTKLITLSSGSTVTVTVGAGGVGSTGFAYGGQNGADGFVIVRGIGSSGASAIASPWTLSGANVIYNSGNVGIGTSTPGQKLTVAGTIESTTGGVKYPDGSTQTSSAFGPLFVAYTNTASAASNGTGWVKLLFNQVEIDTDSSIDTANSRMRPTKAGYYRVTARFAFVATGNGGHTNYLSIYKNGTTIKTVYSLANYTAAFTQTLEITALVYLNGTTDYLEAYFATNNANAATVQTGSIANSFSGEWVRP